MPGDPRRGDPHPTAHALRVFGGAVGMVLIVAGICVLAAQIGGGNGCTRCRTTALIAVAAVIVGGILVRGAWRAMRTGRGGAP